MFNSLTKLECSVCQIGLFSFDSSNSVASFVKFQNRLFTPLLGDIKGLSKTGAREPPCSREVVGEVGGVESDTGEGVLGAGAGESDANGEPPTPPNPSSST
jgi:hypothetical protein